MTNYTEVIARLRRCSEFKCRECEYEYVIACRSKLNDEAADAIEELSNTQNMSVVPQWISVKDRLPENDDHVLAATQNKRGEYNIVKAYYHHGSGCWAAGMNSNVTHWMPLPEPPKEESNADASD